MEVDTDAVVQPLGGCKTFTSSNYFRLLMGLSAAELHLSSTFRRPCKLRYACDIAHGPQSSAASTSAVTSLVSIPYCPISRVGARSPLSIVRRTVHSLGSKATVTLPRNMRPGGRMRTLTQGATSHITSSLVSGYRVSESSFQGGECCQGFTNRLCIWDANGAIHP